MQQVGSSFMELVLMLGLMSGGGNLDIASSLPAKEYFKARGIEVSVDKLMELAAQDPDTGKKQIGQLIALSHLANEPDLLKNSTKVAEHRRLLGEIAQGKKANDPCGFAVNYAEKVLLALDGRKLPPPAKRSWKETVKFLPENANFVGAIDFASSQSAERKLPDVGMIFELMPKEVREEFWTSVEKIGNYQVDSIGYGIVYDANGEKLAEVVARITGKGNPDWLVSSLNTFKEDKTKDRIGPKGEKIRMLYTERRQDPAIAIIGDHEVLIGGYVADDSAADANKIDREVVDRLLAQHRKSPLGPLQGLLKNDLAKVPADANGFVVGSLTKDAFVGAPFPSPMKLLAHAKRIAGGIDVQGFAAMAEEKDAKALIEFVGNTRDQGLQQLNRVQGQPMPIPGLNVGVMIGLLESIQLQTNGSEAQIRLLVADDVMMMLPTMFGVCAVAAGPPPAPPVPAPAPKAEEKK